MSPQLVYGFLNGGVVHCAIIVLLFEIILQGRVGDSWCCTVYRRVSSTMVMFQEKWSIYRIGGGTTRGTLIIDLVSFTAGSPSPKRNNRPKHEVMANTVSTVFYR